jgi:chromosome segregation protein
MLRLESLELCGFKSFADRTKIPIADGTTCIVGPNGCGKSNISDAICWVLGEQSAKSMRGSKMEDVIFAGAAQRKAAGQAEVIMTWRRLEPLSEAQGQSLVLTRRLYRNGESEYLINQNPCRLKDIQSALWDHHMGSRAYSIIEQGRIGQILNAKPQERRNIIEEAAGIAKYRQRRHESELKLAAAEDHLTRIQDILGEVQKQRANLQRQVGRATRYRSMAEELRQLETRLLDFDLAQASVDLGQTLHIQDAAQKKEWNLTTQLVALDARISVKRTDLMQQEQALRSGEGRLAEIIRQMDLDEATRRFELQRREERHLAVQRAVLELSRLSGERVERKERLKVLQQEEEGLRIGLEQAKTQAEADDLHLQRARTQAEQRRKAEAALRLEFEQAAGRERSLRSAGDRGQARLAEWEAQGQAAQGVLSELATALATADRELAGSLQALTQQEEKLVASRQELAQRQAWQNQAESLLQQLLQREGELTRERQRLEDRLAHLRQICQERAHLPEELNRALSAQAEQAPLLRDVLNSRHHYDAALELALQDLVDSLLLPDEPSLEKWRQTLQNTGFSAFVLGDGDEAPPEPAEPEGLVSVMGQLLAPPPVLCVLEEHLRDHYIVLQGELADWSDAFPEWTFLDVFGLVRRRGAHVQCRGGAGGFLQIKGEQDELEQRESELLAEQATLGDRLLAARAQSQDARRQTEQSQGALRQQEEAVWQADALRRGLNDRRLGIALRQQEEQLRLSQRQEQVQSLREEVVCQCQEMAQLQTVLAEKGKELAGFRSEAEKREVELAGIQAVLAAAREKAAASEALLQRIVLESGRLARQEQEQAAAQDELEQRNRSWREEIEGIEASTAALLEKISVSQKDRELLKTTLIAQEEGIQALRNSLEEAETTRKQLVDQRDDLRAEQGRAELEAARLQGRMVQWQEKYLAVTGSQWNPEQRVADGLAAETDAEPLRRECLDLATRLHALGPVNLLAIEEFDEVEARRTFLENQQKDLIDSIAEIRSTIQKLNRLCVEKFRETFQAVNALFSANFQELFGGGSACLHLLEEDRPLESGIDLLVQPPGKKLQNALLLSGGEKAMTAIALLFAIFEYKPSPFCLLDEVDAPLDEVNVTRFMKKLELMKRQTQFIIITHHKLTMNAASHLVGVTMEETGCSKIVSVQFS